MLILLLFHYWVQVLSSKRQHQVQYLQQKKLKNADTCITKSPFYEIPFTFISSLYNYYQLLDVLSVLSYVEIL
jgi:hypothetical protein